jgi:hypothetical protein
MTERLIVEGIVKSMVKSMPSWDVRNKWASKLGVGKDIADLVNRIIDSVGDPEYHDYGRVK